MREKVTAIIPVFNEEKNIDMAINSVSFADEIIVIDSFSTDQTLTRAKKRNVVILQRTFDDFSSQKNYAIDQAKYKWIYILDADERITGDLKDEIVKTLSSEPDRSGFYIYRSFFFYDTRIRYGGWQRDKVMRLFRKDLCKFDGALVHEKINFKGEAGILKNRLLHYSYTGHDQYRSKLESYAALKARSLYAKGAPVNFFHEQIKPPVRFFIDYILRMGFLDGKPGITLASHHYNEVKARYRLLKKLYEIESNSKLSD